MDVSGVEWFDADIRYANLRKARHLDLDEIQGTIDWELAFYDPDILKQLGLPPDNNEAVAAYLASGSKDPFDDSWILNWREKEKSAANPK